MRELQLKFIGDPSLIRLFQLLNYIERERTFTVGSLTALTNVTQRTIIKDLNYLKDYFQGSAEFSSGRRGYQFKETNPEIYKEQKKQLLSNEVLFEIVGNIFYGELETIEELAFLYNYSESTLRRLLVQIKPVLAEYDLELVLNPVNFTGDEGNLRKFFKDFYYEGEQIPHTLTPPKELHELVLTTLSGKMGNYEISTGTTPASFYYTLYIAIERYRQGNKINLPKNLREIIYHEKDYLLLTYLTDAIKKYFGVQMTDEEYAWIYLVTICKRPISPIRHELLFFERFNLWPNISTLSLLYIQEQGENETEGRAKRAFLNSFFLSRKINDSVSPALNKLMSEITLYIKTNHLESYKHNYRFLLENQTFLAFSKNHLEDIAVSLTLFYDSLLAYYTPMKKIIFLLEGDHFICQNIRFNAEQLLGQKHHLIFIPLQNLTTEMLNEKQVDLIVTNYPPYISDYILSTDYLLINSVPDKEDWQRILEKAK